MQVTDNKVVAIDYTLKDDDGQVLDTSDGREPLYYLHGAQNIIPGLENALTGKSSGDTLQVTIPPEEGYGPRSDEMQQTVPRSELPGEVEVGMRFHASGGHGGDTVVTVVEVTDEEVTLDTNHPLAGATLHFDVTVREVRDASQEELDHGHVHGPGGHEH